MPDVSVSSNLLPPFQLAWRINTKLSLALAGSNRLYGVTPTGKLLSIDGASGVTKWTAQGTYIAKHIARQGTRLFAYRKGEGLGFVDDNGTSVAEQLVASFGAQDSVQMSTPVIDDRMVYYVVNQGMYAVHQEQGLQFGTGLGDKTPHTVALINPGEILVVDGSGLPTRYHVNNGGFVPTWNGEPHGTDAGLAERPVALGNNRCAVAVGRDIVGYDLSTGQVAWKLNNTPAETLAVDGDTLYAGFYGATLRAISISDGAILWQRQYVYDTAIQQAGYQLSMFGENIVYGSLLSGNPDGALLLTARTSDGLFTWLSRSASLDWTAGIPVTDGSRIYVYGASSTGAYISVSAAITPDQVVVAPRPLRGTQAQFGAGSIRLDLAVGAKVSIAPYREALGLGSPVVSGANYGAGSHEVSWNPAGAGGFTDANQFGYMLVDVTEGTGAKYTQAFLMPVNTFPDILSHWARNNIEIAVFHRFVSGYTDQTFKPDNLVTRAESSTIIAKTLGLDGPSPGFQTKFTDIATHWAKAYITALEEKGIVGGFAEPDGTYTFRPELNMTRAQEARILVRAYAIPPAPAGFSSHFADIAGHWAEEDIKSLEAAGYVTGFRESDGSYTYRPERNLTRAELCTVVVRIRDLKR